jgi:hypothetical protein
MAAGKGETMKRTIALLLVLPMTGLANADTLIFPNDVTVEKYRENDSPLIHFDEKLNMFEPDDPRSILKDFRPVTIEPYPQQIITTDPQSFPRYNKQIDSIE